MSRREIFIEFARAANDLALEAPPEIARPHEAVRSPGLGIGHCEILIAIGRLEARLTSAEQQRHAPR